ncbi:MAG: hypothetical protein K2X69_14145 [Silvanigrellaceae bacterium]|nr:hypothetical protein [Silvanigrellaceae bacterium]
MIKTYRGRPFADWATCFFELDPATEYSFEDLCRIFNKSKIAIEGQIRKAKIKPRCYRKIHNRSRIALFLGQDIISEFKRKSLMQRGLIEELIVSDIKRIAKRKEKIEHKINLFLAISSKTDKDLANELKLIMGMQ